MELPDFRRLDDSASRPVRAAFHRQHVRAAVASAVDGHGLARLFSYHVAKDVKNGTLQIVLSDSEHAPLPAHLLTPHGRLSVPKVRAFVDFATPRLRRQFRQLRLDSVA